MTTEYLCLRDNPARHADSPRFLCPPLRDVWSRKDDHWVRRLPRVNGGRVYVMHGRRLLCLDEWKPRKTLWSAPLAETPSVVVGRHLLGWDFGDGGLVVRDGISGASLKSAEVPWGEIVAVGGVLAGHGGGATFVLESESLQALWLHKLVGGIGGAIACANEQALFYEQRKSDSSVLRALTLREGREIWRRPVDETKRNRSCATGILSLFDQTLIVRLLGARVIALDSTNGRLQWEFASDTELSDGYLYGGRYYLLSSRGEIHILDGSTGAVVKKFHLGKSLPAKLIAESPFYPLLVSETHFWTGLGSGYIVAFERATGKYAWHGRTKTRCSFDRQTTFMTCNGRLYLADMSCWLYCMEEEEATDPVLAGRRAGEKPKAAGRGKAKPADSDEDTDGLAFEILATAARQKLTARAPYFGPGGGNLILRSRAKGGGEFCLAVRPPKKGSDAPSSSEGRLWVPSVADGDALLSAVRSALRVRGGQAGAAKRIKAPTSLEVTFLGGTEEWVRTKWTGEEGVPEFFVEWNLDAKRGWIREKDSAYDRDVVDLFASLVVRA